ASDHSINNVSEYYLSLRLPEISSLIGDGRQKLGLSQTSPEAAMAWLAPQADAVSRLQIRLNQELNSTGNLAGLYKYYELALTPVLQRMERQGIAIDPEMLHQQSQALAKRLAEVEVEVHSLAGESFNLGSPKQLQAILYDKLQLPV